MSTLFGSDYTLLSHQPKCSGAKKKICYVILVKYEPFWFESWQPKIWTSFLVGNKVYPTLICAWRLRLRFAAQNVVVRTGIVLSILTQCLLCWSTGGRDSLKPDGRSWEWRFVGVVTSFLDCILAASGTHK